MLIAQIGVVYNAVKEFAGDGKNNKIQLLRSHN